MNCAEKIISNNDIFSIYSDIKIKVGGSSIPIKNTLKEKSIKCKDKCNYCHLKIENKERKCKENSKKFEPIKFLFNKEEIGFLSRQYYEECILYPIEEKKCGKVVEHKMFALYPHKYKQKGIGRQINTREEKIYINNGFEQIHLEAAEDGVVVWARSFDFKFADNEGKDKVFSNLDNYILNYFDDIAQREVKRLKKNKDLKQIPKEYFLAKNEISFGEFCSQLENMITIVMYKNLPKKKSQNLNKDLYE